MKRILLILLSVIMVVSLVACKKNNFEEYAQAVNKASKIKRGQESYNFKIALDFNTEGLTQEEIKHLNYFKDTESKVSVTYDVELKKTIARTYFNMAGLGFDSVYYNDGEKSFIKMPILGKYIILDEKIIGENSNNEENLTKDMDLVFEKVSKRIVDKWLKTIRRDDVFSGRDSVMTTPDGEVKVTEYSIKLTSEQFKTLLSETIEIISEDKKFREEIEKYTKQYTEEEVDIDLDELFKNIKDGIEDSEIDNLSYVSYIDIDGYIIKENMNFDVRFKDEESKRLNSVKFIFETNRWSIDKEQEFVFPELTEENTLGQDELEQGVPFMFENVFDKDE